MRIHQPWKFSQKEIALRLKTNIAAGLSTAEATKRLRLYGPNKLPDTKQASWLMLFFAQCKNVFVLLLSVASLLSFSQGALAEGFAILGILVINAAIGAIQEGKANNTLASLKQYIAARGFVIRDGKEQEITEDQIVIGDIIILREGDRIPADARIITSNELRVNEASLTGESGDIQKTPHVISSHKPIPAEQKNIVFKGSLITSGNATAMVFAAGIQTQIGAIGSLVSQGSTPFPLQKKLAALSRNIIGGVTILIIFFLFLEWWSGKEWYESVHIAISLAVSAIPEGLPAVITVVLARGAWRMAKKNALIRKLQAIEGLSHVDVIAVDKTGTLTKNELTLQKIITPEATYEFSGSGYDPKGDIIFQKGHTTQRFVRHSELLLSYAALTANARLTYEEASKTWQSSGDATEMAFLVGFAKTGLTHEALTRSHPRRAEIPFTSTRKSHAVLIDGYTLPHGIIAGAPEVIFPLCTQSLKTSLRTQDFDKKERAAMEKEVKKYAHQGYRVLALAYTTYPTGKKSLTEKDLQGMTFGGIFIIRDAIRPEVPEAIKRTIQMGIRPVMITGDHVLAAKSIGQSIGIFKPGDYAMTGEELDSLTDHQLSALIDTTTIFARVTPEHKMRIITLLQKKGLTVAMTGDGVNDAPALMRADLGIAMGKLGTEVAKEASDIILLDDNFASIARAVEEGERVFKTIRTVLIYLFSTNLAEIVVLSIAIILAVPLPLNALQILWLNLVTDGFITIAFAFEPHAITERPNNKKRTELLEGSHWIRIAFLSGIMIAGSLVLYLIYLPQGYLYASTMTLTALAAFQWYNAFNTRSESISIFSRSLPKNTYLIGAVGVVALLQVCALLIPWMQGILSLTPLRLGDAALAFGVPLVIILAEELRKYIVRSKIT